MNKKHPKALPYLFLSEMWERFGFYLMLGIFFLYMTIHSNISEINENQQDSNLTTLNSLDDYNLNSTVPIPVSVPVIKDAFDDFDDSFDENEFQKIEFDKEIKNKK